LKYSVSMPDLQSFPLTMVVGNALDPSSPEAIKNISKNILYRIPQPIIVIDYQGRIVMVNKFFCNMTHPPITENELNNITFEDLSFTDKALNKILDFGIPATEYRDNLKLNKKKIPVKINIYPIFGDSQVRLGAVCTIADITTDVNYGELLQKSEIILDSINTGVIAVDKNLKINMFNKYAEHCFSVSQNDFYGEPYAKFIENFEGDWVYILDSLKNNTEIRDYELVLLINGNQNHFICDTHLLRNDFNEIYGTILVFKNISHIKNIESQLARSEKLKAIGELAAGTAHEIRNPLTTIRGIIQFIHDKSLEKGVDCFDSYMQLLLSEVDRINKIISSFLDLAKPQKKTISLININELLNEVIMLMTNESLQREISIKKYLEESLPSINGDKDELAQVFLNIIRNAFQAMTASGDLTIKSYPVSDHSYINIDFIDNGECIPEDIITKIFDPFFSTKEEGTGLGLAISNRIVNDHKGELKVSSVLGEGTKFTVILPVCEVTKNETCN